MFAMTPLPERRAARLRTRLRIAAAALVVVTVAACSSGGDDDDGAASSAPSSGAPTTTATIAGTVPTTPASSAPGTAPDATAPDQGSTAPTTVPVPAPTTPAPAPATTEPLAVQELVLSGDGLGGAVFGAEPQGVIDYVSSILGGNTADTGWVPPDTFAVCDGTEARRVDWGTLSLLFTDLSPIANGRRHFIGYEYGRVGQIDEEPVGLRTEGGVTRGSRVIDLLAEFPDAAINEGEPDSGFPDGFYVSDVFYGLLTGTTAEDYVTVLFGGYGCFE